MKTILVTGGAGFIGSHTVERLVKEGYGVIVVDDLSTGNMDNLKSVIDNITVIRKDVECITNDDLAGVYGIIHLAALANVPSSWEYIECYHRVNVTSTLHLLLKAIRNGVKHFVFASSSSVYGNSYPNIECLSPYAFTKYGCEKYLQFYADKICLTIPRYFNVYGSRQSAGYGSVIPTFINRALEGKPLQVYGGEQLRDFIHVKDVARFNVNSLESCDRENYPILEVGSNKQISIIELAKYIINATDSKSEIEYLPQRVGEPMSSLAECSYLQQITPLEIGIQQTIDYYKK